MSETQKHTKPNVPNLRFPGFSGEWEQYTLGELTELFSRRNKKKIDYPMFSVTNSRGFVNQQEQFEDREMKGEDLTAYKIISPGEYAYNPARINVGSIARYDGDSDCMISSLYVCFKANKELVDSQLILHVLKSPKMVYNYGINSEGGVRIYLFYPNFARIKVHLPCLDEQRKIASFLNLIEERIMIQIKLIEELKKLKTAIIKETLRQLHVTTLSKLGNHCHIETGKLDANAMVNDGKYMFFTCAKENYRTDTYAFDGEALLISGNGELGLCKYYSGKFNAYQRTYVLRDFDVDVHYLKLMIESFLPQKIYREKNVGTMPYIVISTLTDLQIPIPDSLTQNRISNIYKTLEEMISVEENVLFQHRACKRAFLYQLFI